jgi:hypothetical protein
VVRQSPGARPHMGDRRGQPRRAGTVAQGLMARQKVRIEAHGLVELLTATAAGRHSRRVGAGARQCPEGQRQSAAVAVRLRERVEELRVRHSASVPGPRPLSAAELFALSGDFPLATASGIDPAGLACRGVPAWLPRLCRTWRRRLSSHRNTATPTAGWRLRWILQSSEEPTDVVDVQGGRLHRREVPATVEVGPVSAGQRMDVHDMVDEIGCLISRSLCCGTVTPGPGRAGRRVLEQFAGGR